MLEQKIKDSLPAYFGLIESDIIIEHSNNEELVQFLNEISEFSSQIKLRSYESNDIKFNIAKAGESPRVHFWGVPLGHEFSSFIMALLQTSGRKPKIDEDLITKIKSIDREMNFETYISLSCHNCPDVVQALNIMSVLNPKITHTMIDGARYGDLVKDKDIMALPTTYLNGEFIFSGKKEIAEIVSMFLDEKTVYDLKDLYDITIIGGGPSASASAIYSARKGLKTLIISDRFGGQVLDTVSIENFISVKETEGKILASNLHGHVTQYDVDIAKGTVAKGLTKEDNIFKIELANGQMVNSKSVIVSTGAKWRELGIPGEREFKNKGVAYCPHCDGPLFKGKDVAVVGGGNSGVEAAIDLAAITGHVTLFEFAPSLKADKVLQDKLRSLPNVTVHTNAATKEIYGDGKVQGISYTERETGNQKNVKLDGVFVQIGLVPNTEFLTEVTKNKMGEIVVDKYNATNIPGLFAAGDCTDIPYKQIISSMGDGAKAALSAFDYLIRN